MRGTAMLIVDPQNDFHEGGSLAVPGANEDAERIAKLITDHTQSLDELIVTLDSHHRMDIAHPLFWVGRDASHPAPFSTITADDVKNGTWMPTQEVHREHCIEYTTKLEEGGRFKLTIWPEHCLVGTMGHAVNSVINEALQTWAATRKKMVTYVMKGQHPLSEHYSCFAAEVPVDGDEADEKGRALLAKLCTLDRVLVCGQASSHCVNFSSRDLAAAWQDATAGAQEDEARGRMSGLVLIKDAASAVPGFETEASKLFSDMEKMGVRVTTCAEALSS